MTISCGNLPGPAGSGTKESRAPCLVSRRSFLLWSGITTAVIMVGIPGRPGAQTPAVVSTYPRKLIGKLSSLELNEPVDFEYPDEGGLRGVDPG